MENLRTCLWMESRGEEAAEFYVSLLPGSKIEGRIPADPAAPALIVNFTLMGVPYQILNGGPHYTLSPAASISVMTGDQAETDRLWAALVADGGAESRCGWCTDRFGLSWQVVPKDLPGLVGGPDPAGAKRATEAMLGMAKIDIAALRAAYRG